MQSKVIFFVLFMLTFTVAHDTVINIIHTNEHTAISQYGDKNVQVQECDNIDEIHGMFHFLGLVMPYENSFIQLPVIKTLSSHSLQYTPPYKESSYKPPKA